MCWTARDAYFDCLTSKGVTIPPGTDMSDGRGLVGKAAAEDQKRAPKSTDADPCQPQRAEYEAHCAKSWVRHDFPILLLTFSFHADQADVGKSRLTTSTSVACSKSGKS